jgi:Protein of unknown function (DUF1806)
MEPIQDKEQVQQVIDQFANDEVYIHLETTNGAYASHNDETFLNAGCFIRNAKIKFSIGKIVGNGPYRVGLKLDLGWVYGEGITHYEVDELGRLLMAGHDSSGKLAIAFEISKTPFE